MKEVVISIIIPIYKPQPVIFEVLDSVLELAQKVDVEVILVYNGDENNIRLNDLKLHLSKGGANFSGILLQEANVCIARNTGFAVASGRFVKFLDADDILIVDSVVRQIGLLSETHIDVVTGEYRARLDDGGSILRPRRVRTPFQGLMSGDMGITSSALFRRVAILDMLWKKELVINEEKEFYWSCAQKGLQFFHLPEAVFVKTLQPNSLSTLANETGKTSLAVAEFRLRLWKAMRRSMSPGEQSDCGNSLLLSFNEVIQMPSLKGTRLATKILISGGLPYKVLSVKQKVSVMVFSPLIFPFVFSVFKVLTKRIKINAEKRVCY